MIKSLFSFLLAILLFLEPINAQRKFRAPVWTFHDNNTTIVGLSAGLTSADDKQVNVHSYGVHIELLGFGFISPLMPSNPLSDTLEVYKKRPASEKIAGLHISPLGTISSIEVSGISINGIGTIMKKANGINFALIMNYTGLSNGIQLVGFFNSTYVMNGLQLALVSNEVLVKSRGIQIGGMNDSPDHTGLQIGITNKAGKLRGLQFGLWNVNNKRKLPILNWW